MSSGWYEFTGQPPGLGLGRGWADAVHPADQGVSQTAFQEANAARRPYRVDFRVRRHDGVYRWAIDMGRPRFDPAGDYLGMVGSVVDIDDRKRVEVALAGRERELQSLADNTPDILTRFGPDLKHLFVNAAVEQAIGVGPSAVVGRTQRELDLPAGLCDLWDTALRDVFAAGRPRSIVFGHAGPTGERHYAARLVPEFGLAGGVETVLAVTQDVTAAKAAEATVARLEADRERQRRLYETMLKNTADINYIFDPDARFVFGNEKLTTVLGREWADVAGRPLEDIGYTPELADKLQRQVREVVATGCSVRDETPFTGAVGTRDYEYIFAPVFGPDGAVEAVAGSTRDITDRRQMEEALRASEARFRFLDALGQATRGAADPGEVMAVTARLLGEHLGVTRCAYADVDPDQDRFTIRHDWTDGVPSTVGVYSLDLFGPRAAADQRAGRSLVVRDMDRELAPAAGGDTFRAIGIRAVICCPLLRGGRLTAMMAVHHAAPRDWTAAEVTLVEAVVERSWAYIERVRAEAQLVEAHQFFHSSLDALSSHIAVLDENGVIVAVNDAWRRFADENHYPGPNYGVGSSYVSECEAGSADDRGIAAGLQDVLHGRKSLFETEYPCHSPTQERWFVMRVTRFKPPGPVRVVVSHENVTQRVKSEHALRDADRRKDEFLATLAHELRNPLAPIRTGLEVLDRDPAAGTAGRTRAMMARHLGHMVRLVDDLLDVSRITHGQLDLRRERISLAAVVETALEASRPLVTAAGHTLEVDLPQHPVWLDADLTRLAQVVSNLVNNAAKYTPNGGRITVTAAVDGPTVVLRVADTGLGIPADQLPAVFEMFAQVNHTLNRSQGGLGIGLTLVRRLIEMHGGTVTAASPGAGRGSTFTVRLPTAAGPPPEITSRPIAAAGPVRVLVVDDNIDGAESLAMLLDLTGHTTRTAYTGPAAVAAAQAFLPEVMFLDIGLPGMTGYEVAAELRASPPAVRPLIVALTGWGSADDKAKGVAAGIDRHLTKPVDPAVVMALMAGFCAGR